MPYKFCYTRNVNVFRLLMLLRARRPFNSAKLYAWLECYFVIQQQEMEDEEEDDESGEGSETAMDEDKLQTSKETRAKQKAADAKSSEEDMQEDQPDSSAVTNPADLKRLRDNVDRDLGQVCCVSEHACLQSQAAHFATTSLCQSLLVKLNSCATDQLCTTHAEFASRSGQSSTDVTVAFKASRIAVQGHGQLAAREIEVQGMMLKSCISQQ